MSIRLLTNGRPAGAQSAAASSATRRLVDTQVAQWVRPTAWLALPSVTGQQRFAGLHRIDRESNFVALTAAGAYTVDWGDGTQTNHSSNTTAQKQYDYATIPNTGEASLGYRQVIIQVYPQAGQNLTSLSLQVRHNQSGLSTYTPGWLEVAINGSNLATLNIGGTIPLSYLEQATIGDHALTSAASLFWNCRELQSVPLFNTASVTNMNNMFNGCSSLTSVPLFNTASVTNMNNMFNGCSSLASVPLFNTAVATSMNNMFNGCSALTTVPLFNTVAVTSMNNMFNNCSALVTVPLFNTAAVTNMSSMFINCSALVTVPLFNTAAVTSMSNMFSSCGSLTTVPLFNTATVTSMGSMFSGCSALTTVPLFNTAAVTSMNNMFSNCSSLTTVPLFNTASVTDMANMFNGCAALTTVPPFNTAAVTSMSSMFNNCSALVTVPPFNTAAVTSMFNMFINCSSLSSVSLTGFFRAALNVAGCKLSAAALDALYTSLGTANGATVAERTITVTGNWGTASDDPTIATAKNWTVTG